MFTTRSPSSVPTPQKGAWESFAQHVFFAGRGFRTGDPGSMLDVLAKARTTFGGGQQLVHYLAVPPVAFAGLTKALGEHWLAKGARRRL